MKKPKLFIVLFATLFVAALAVISLPSSRVEASSHREAPYVSTDPQIDTTDVYAFRSPDLTNTVTLIANWIPLEQPAAGPNFYRFADDGVYEINIDNVGDAMAHITYQFRFRTVIGNGNTFLYNTGQVTSLSDPDLNVKQFYSLTKITRNNGQVTITPLLSQAPVAPNNVGPRSMPDYASLANAAVSSLPGGGQAFVGPRDDPFFVDLGSVFDLVGLRPLNNFHIIPLTPTPGVDGVAGYNVETTSIQVPISSLGSSNGVIGVWATGSRNTSRVALRATGSMHQFSRLGMPLVNEVVIPINMKDKFNSSQPSDDAQFLNYVTSPETTGLINFFYPPVIDAPTSGRSDLVAVFLTGIPMLNQLPTVTPSEMIRLNTNIAPTSNPNRLGVTAGDFAGFPNGRRLLDDVVDIELRAFACSYGVVGTVGPCDDATYNQYPNNALTDGVDANEKPFLSAFPYMALPYSGYEAMPPTAAPSMKAALGFFGAVAGAGALALFWRRRRQSA